MLSMPFMLPLWLLGLGSIALLGGGVYLIYAWYAGIVVGTAYLAWGVVMTVVSLFGRFIVLGLARRPGDDDPQSVRSDEHRFVEGDGGERLFVETIGPADAPVVVLTHGWGLDGTVWYYLKKRLGGRYRLVVWDLPGLGRSSEPADRDYDLERLARDLRAVLESAGDRPAILLGHSIGGMITLTFCRLFPELLGTRVHGLVLTNTTYTNPVRTTTGRGFFTAAQGPLLTPLMHLTVLLSPLLRVGSAMSYLNGTAHLAAALTSFTGRESREVLEFMSRFTVLSSPAVLARGILAMFRYDATEVLPRIEVPTLVVSAPVDRITIPQASERMAAEIPRAELTVLSPAGHDAPMEQHAAFGDAVEAFAGRVFGAATGAGTTAATPGDPPLLERAAGA